MTLPARPEDPAEGQGAGKCDDRALTPAARRALAEAAARRRAGTDAAQRPAELGGRDGPDPARYGDWEKKGIAIDF
jgi:hypothetical protein